MERKRITERVVVIRIVERQTMGSRDKYTTEPIESMNPRDREKETEGIERDRQLTRSSPNKV